MIHVFRLGPVPAASPPSFAFAAVLPSGKLEVRLAPADEQGLVALREALEGLPLACEPALAEAAKRLRMVVAPLPPEALQARARLACELAAGLDREATRPEATAALLKAAVAFWSSRLWELIAPGEPLHVGFDLGQGQRYGLLALEASDPNRPRLLLCDDPDQLERLRGLPGEEAIAGLGQGAGLTVELAEAPAWAAAAIEEGAALSRLPRLERRRGGVRAPAGVEDAAMGAALLAGMVAFADLGAVGDVDVEVEAGPLHLKVRVGTTQPAPPAPVAAPEADALSPEELAAIVRGGGAPAEDAPAAAPEEAAPEADALSPEELAALMKGGSAPPPEPPTSPVPQPAEPAPAVTVLDAAEVVPAPPVEPPSTGAPPSAGKMSVPLAKVEAVPTVGADDVAAPRPAAAPEPQGEGWLRKAWHALGSSLKREGSAAPPAPKPAAAASPRVAPKPGPAARREPPPPPPAPPPDPDRPFAPFARALRVAVPAEPAAWPLAEHERAEALARQLVEGAVAQEHFVSFPAVALQIIELVHAPDADARGVAGFISRDPGLAADVLAVANSAAFRGVSGAGSVREAVARLGLQEVGRVASAVSARALLLPARAGGGAPSTQLFTRAVAVATAASAAALQLRGAHSDQVWLAGLLHDVGIALGASALDRLGAAGGPGVPRPLAERAVELAHVEIGAAALKAWGLPPYIADVCARHHDPEVLAGPELLDLHLVRLTSALARLGEPEVGARAAREILQSARALGFDVHAVRALSADLRAAEQRAAVLVR